MKKRTNYVLFFKSLVKKHLPLKFIIILSCIVIFNQKTNAQATTIFSQNFESASWNTASGLSPAWSSVGTGNNQWQLNSYTTGWTSASGAYSPTGANGTTQSARFHSYNATSGSTGDLISPTIDFSAYPNQPKTLLFYMINTSGTDKLDVYLSTDGSSFGSSLGTFTVYSSWTLIRVPLGTTSSSTIKIKFTATSDYGATDIGIDEVKIVNADVFTTTGSWIAPAGVCDATIECWGGGGAGGSARASSTTYYAMGGGGAGGTYVRDNITVSVGSSYTVTVGAAVTGTTGTTNVRVNGNPTWFGSTSTIYAEGGQGGLAVYLTATGNAFGTGGTASSSSSIGSTKYAGGNGADGSSSSTYGGGGGSSGGIAVIGNNASGATGGTAPLGAGAGANGSTTTNIVGAPGFSPGGGGSGGFAHSTTQRVGGSGASGLVYISYIPTTLLSTPIITTTSLCPGSSVTVSGTCAVPDGTTITIYKNTSTSLGTTTVSSGSWSISGLTVSNNDTITSKASNGGSCNTSLASNSVIVPPVYTATATATPSSICAGGSTNLSVTVSNAGSASIGSGTSSISSTTSVGAAYGSYYGNGHAQILVLASELTAAGFVAGNLTGMSFNITGLGSPTSLTNYTIKIGATSATAITTFQSPTFTTVYTNASYTPIIGTNIHTFSTAFNWNGTSNIIIDYCFANSVTGTSSAINTYTTTTFGSFVNYNVDGAAGAGACSTTTVSNASSNRPNFILFGQKTVSPTAYSWSDGVSSVGSTNPLSVSPTTNTSYTCTTTVNGCSLASNSVPVTVTTVVAPTANVSSSSQCGSAIPTVSVSGTAADMRWYNASSGGTLLQTGGLTYSTAISTTTTFYVAQVSGSCESTSRTPLTVTVSSPDALTASASSLSICQGNSVNLSVSQTGSTNSYSLVWTASPAAGSGIPTSVSGSLSTPTTITPTANGTYVYTITGTDGSCVATSTISVTVNAAPSITVNPTNPATACNTTNATLAATTANATSWQWQSSSTSGGTYTNVANGTPSGATYTGGNTTSLAISSLTSTYYYKLVASSAGCTDAISTVATVAVNNPSITSTTPAARCGPGTVTLSANGSTGTTLRWYSALTGGTLLSVGTIGAATASYTTPSISTTTTYYVSAYNPTSGTAVIGVGATTNASYPNPLYSNWANQKQQVLILASELQNSGLVAGNLTEMSLNLTSTSTTTRTGFTINLAHTTASALTTTYLTPSFTQVYTGNYTPAVGVNSFPFGTGSGSSSSFNWDGTSNLLMEICWDNTASTATISSTATSDITAYASVVSYNRTTTTGTSICGTTVTGTTYTVRPRYTFTGQVACSSTPRQAVDATINTAPSITPTGTATICSGSGTTLSVSSSNDPNYTYTWTPSATVSPTTGASVTATPTTTTKYYVTASDASGGTYNGCTSIDSITITVNNIPAAVSTGISPANNATGVCYAGTGAVSALSWTAVSGATSYDVYFGTTTTPSLVSSAQTGTTYSTSTLSANTQYYWKVVAKNSCGDAVGSSTWTFTTNLIPCTCTSIPTSNDNSGITSVTVGSATFPVADVMYYNYTSSIPDLTQGTTVTSSVTFATGYTYNTNIWIDLNDDGVFDNTTELVFQGESLASNPTTLNTSFLLNSSAAVGYHKMRIGTADAGQATPTPCYSGTYGVTIDLVVHIVAPIACTGTPSTGTAAYSGGTICANSGTATITSTGYSATASGLSFQWLSSSDNFVSDTTSIVGANTPSSYTTSTLTTTTYYMLRAYCANSDIIAYSNVITVPVNSPTITSIMPAARCDAGTLTLSATGSAGTTIKWYSSISGGTALATGTAGAGTGSYTTGSLAYPSTTTYYVEAVNGTCTSIPRTAVLAMVVQPTTNPTVTPNSASICEGDIVALTASGSTVNNVTLLYDGFESTSSTFTYTDNGDGYYTSPHSRSGWAYPEGSKDAVLYSETDYWWWIGDYGVAGNVNMTQSTAIDLSNYADAKLSFYHICATEAGYDFGIVQYNNGSGWQNFPSSAYIGSGTLKDANGNSSTTDQIAFDKSSYSDWNSTFTQDYYDYLDGSNSTYVPTTVSTSLWKREEINLTPYLTNNFRIRFRYTFDDITDYYGWTIDSVAISGTKSIKYVWSPKIGLYTDAAATMAYDSIITPNITTVYSKITPISSDTTITYKAISYTDIPSASCSGVNTATINISKKPSATLDAIKLYVCDGTAELKASAVNPTSTTLTWSNISGSGVSSVTGNPATVTGLTAGTSIYQLKLTNGQCIDVPIGNDTIVMPTTSTTDISTTIACNLCVLTDGNTRTYYNSNDGKIIAKIEDDATVTPNQLNETQVCVNINSSVQSVIDNLSYTQPYLPRQWTIHPTNGTRAKVTLYFTNAELLALQTATGSGVYQFSGYGSLTVTKYSGGQDGIFTAPASSGGVSVPSTFSAYGSDHKVEFVVDDFSTFYIHPELFPFAVLPVELISFTAWNNSHINQLQWKSASENNLLKYEIEKSTDGSYYAYIGEMSAAGNSSQLLTYDFNDNNPVIGNNFYRLKIIDNDGNFTYSNVVNVPIAQVVTNSISKVYPNPTSGNLTVKIQSMASVNTNFSVYDVLGNIVFEQSISLIYGENKLDFDFSLLANGTYVLSYTDNNGKIQKTKFVKN